MAAGTYSMTMPGAMLQRGFWLYVWRVETPQGELLYVGRTGDNSSPFAVPPYQRMGQHLGRVQTQNALRKHLIARNVEPEACGTYELVTHGPIFPEQADMATHIGPRNIVAALEKCLADSLRTAGYDVLNTVNCKAPLDESLWTQVRDSFVEYFPNLRKYRS